MRSTTLIALGALVALVAASAHAQDAIKIESAWARRAPAGHAPSGAGHATHGNGAVYVTLSNQGTTADAVVSATSDAAEKVELHETRNEGGVMVMRPLARFDVPAGGKLEMKPGGHHVMLLGLKRDLKPGQRVKVTLTFEKAGPKTVEAEVR